MHTFDIASLSLYSPLFYSPFEFKTIRAHHFNYTVFSPSLQTFQICVIFWSRNGKHIQASSCRRLIFNYGWIFRSSGYHPNFPGRKVLLKQHVDGGWKFLLFLLAMPLNYKYLSYHGSHGRRTFVDMMKCFWWIRRVVWRHESGELPERPEWKMLKYWSYLFFDRNIRILLYWLEMA